MKKIVFILLICLSACVTDKGYDIFYKFKNSTKQAVSIIYWRSGNILQQNNVDSQQTVTLEEESSSMSAGISSFLLYYTTDSVQIVFADGKIKTDKSIKSPPIGPLSIYNPSRYLELSCGKNCKEYIYTIDEQDYAEAK